MTALMVVKYGNFNQSVLLTNLVYDTALTIRTAQNYGLSVKGVKDASGAPVSCGNSTADPNFQCAYGVAFDSSAGNNDRFTLFAIADPGQVAGSNNRISISTYTLKRGATISGVCGGDDTCNAIPGQQLYITFKRPDPSANIVFVDSGAPQSSDDYAKITIKGTDNTMRSISVRSNGQISVDI